LPRAHPGACAAALFCRCAERAPFG
jgi:hypothetical protein